MVRVASLSLQAQANLNAADFISRAVEASDDLSTK
jgi:hypothetical protein